MHTHTDNRVWLPNFYTEKICIYLLIYTHSPLRQGSVKINIS